MHQKLRSLTACLCLLTAPDIIPDHVKSVAGETRVDLGPFVDQVCIAYEVKRGDTLTSIARVQFGDAARTADIAERNPTVEPTRLRIGQVLWLPPRDQTTKDPAYVFLWAHGPGTVVEPFLAGKAPPYAHYGGLMFYLVTKDHIEAFLKASPTMELSRMVEKGTVVQLLGSSHPRYVHDDSPVDRVMTTIRFAKDKDGKPTVATTNVYFDKDGRQLDAAVIEKPPTPEPKKELLLLMLALAGGTWLWHRARHASPQLALA